MLLATVALWSLMISAQRYALLHGMSPLTFAVLRNTLTGCGLAVLTVGRERSLALSRRHAAYLAGLAGIGLWLNQLSMTYALRHTTASNVALVLGIVPVIGLGVSGLLGFEAVTRRAVVAALVSLGGVVLVALSSGAEAPTHLVGDVLAFGAAASWATYSVGIVPLVRYYSPLRIGALAFLFSSVPLWATGQAAVRAQDYHLPVLVWLALTYAGVSLVLSNSMWFAALARVGATRATLFANLQPFLAAVVAVVLLSESLGAGQLLGGTAIAIGIVLVRRGGTAQPKRATLDATDEGLTEAGVPGA